MNTKGDLPPLPPLGDLQRLIRFSVETGRIWLGEQRMLLMHLSALASWRRELISSVGHAEAKRILLRAGFEAGQQDALLARQVRPQASLFSAFAVGPQLHMLEGAVKVTPLQFEYDPDTPHYLGRFRWDHSWEAETHRRDFGIQSTPVCWMLLGYASGYTTGFFGRLALYKETMCYGSGSAYCLIEGRFAEEWPDAATLRQEYAPPMLLNRLGELHSQVEALRQQINPCDDIGELIGASPAFLSAVELVRKAASTNVTVLLLGETGVGKERFARALHHLSARRDGPFVAVNCAALPHELIESELFGAERGAFTGASVARAGRFERAHRGTLFLDEVGELPLEAQAKLLRVLQTGEIDRLGGAQPVKVDVRLVAATNVDLETAVREGRFRRDLYYRLNVFPIKIPPLRERREDIPLLAQHLLENFMHCHGKKVVGLSDRAVAALMQHDWPGNVRELENLIERGLILAPASGLVEAEHLFPTLPPESGAALGHNGVLTNTESSAGKQWLDWLTEQGWTLEQLEQTLMQEAVERHHGNLTAAARTLGLTRAQLAYRLSKSSSSNRNGQT